MSAFPPSALETIAYGDHAASLATLPFPRTGLGGAMDPRDAMAKRAADIVLASLALSVLGVPMLLAAAAIRLTSKGPALFRQQRTGLHGRPFVVLKFRTMRHAAAPPAHLAQATRDDPRVTRIGAWLRRTSFDELPQLLNVLAGSMSLVGPRPHAPGTLAAGRPFEAITTRYGARHAVKPGMTGLAQVRGWRGETDTEEKLLRRIDSDLEYIATWSLGRDLRIIGRTIVTVPRMTNAY
ncbi:MAG TPA: sugar transferase [Rhodopila sp.]|jgi:lipopolysaccharide/colanic/teichoic acid biosynthesis glycosyltransferase|nr:sugar transferase [Rhodopila sp.]